MPLLLLLLQARGKGLSEFQECMHNRSVVRVHAALPVAAQSTIAAAALVTCR